MRTGTWCHRVLSIVLWSGTSLLAQGVPPVEQVRALSNQLLHIQALMHQATPAAQANLRAQAAPVAERREAALAALIAESPAEALRAAFPPDVVASMAAAFPQSAGRLEIHGRWEGRLEYIIEDGVNLSYSRDILHLHTAGGTYELHFAGRPPERISCGALLAVVGLSAGDRIAAQQATVTQAAASAGCSTTGLQKVAVILVNLPSAKLPTNVTYDLVNGIFMGNSYTTVTNNPDWSISDFWTQNSDGKTSVNPPGASPGGLKVVGPYTLASDMDFCANQDAFRRAAYAAADADLNYAEYSRIVIVGPNYGCSGTAGIGTLGCWGSECPGDGACNFSWTWWRGDQMASRSLGVRLGTHEMGHNLTMHHATSRDHGTEVVGPIGVSGTTTEYGDLFGTMGSWNFGFYNAQHSVNQLAWLSGANYQTVTGNGSYSIAGFDTRPAGVKALKIQRGTASQNAWFWLAYYPNSGIYLSQLGTQIHSGAIIHYQDSATYPGKTDLLDFTPLSSGGHSDPALAVGQTWQDPYTNLSIWVDSIVNGVLNVTVNYGVVPCTAANPSVTLSPDSNSVYEGASTTYMVTVRNNDSSSCAARDFDLAATLNPASSLVGLALSPTSLSLNPAAQGTSTLTASAQAGSTGQYTITVTASASSPTSTGSDSAGLTVSVKPPSPPAAPSGLTAAAVYSGSGKNKILARIELSWTDNSSDETGFRIEHCAVTGSKNNKVCTFAWLTNVGPNVRTFPDTEGLVAGNAYQYRVRAENANGFSAWATAQVATH